MYFVDASHFVLASFLGWVWCFVRLHVRAASGRQRYNVLGALNAVTHELVTEINTTYITATSVCALLHTIARRAGSVPVTLVLDNARYQRCVLVQDAAKQLGIELLFLPSYSPNLNLIERLWKFVKKDVLNSRHHQDFKRFQSAIDGCLADLPTKHREKLATLLAHNFQTWNNVSLLITCFISFTEEPLSDADHHPGRSAPARWRWQWNGLVAMYPTGASATSETPWPPPNRCRRDDHVRLAHQDEHLDGLAGGSGCVVRLQVHVGRLLAGRGAGQRDQSGDGEQVAARSSLLPGFGLAGDDRHVPDF